MSSNPVIEIDELHKTYGDYSVLRGVSLRVGAGEVYGLLGANGAGKTTLVHVLLGLLRPTRGRVRVLSVMPTQANGRIGYLPERLRYHLRFTAREYLHFMGQFDDMQPAALRDRAEYLLKLVELHEFADRMMTTYSKGMLQRLGVAQALLSDPDLLLIDEPTSGLDPNGQREVLDILAEVRGRGHTIFLCTHYLSEVERLCDRVGVLSAGRIGAEVEVESLRGPSTSVGIQVGAIDATLRATLSAIGPEVICRDSQIVVRPNTPALQARVLRALLDADAPIIALEPLESPLEALFARAAGKPRADAEAHSTNVYQPSNQLPNLPSLALPNPPLANPPHNGEGPRSSEGDTLLRELLKRNKDVPENE